MSSAMESSIIQKPFGLSDKETTSTTTDAAPADSDNTVYPGALRLTFIIASLSVGFFLVALDRTIVAPAM